MARVLQRGFVTEDCFKCNHARLFLAGELSEDLGEPSQNFLFITHEFNLPKSSIRLYNKGEGAYLVVFSKVSANMGVTGTLEIE